MLKSQIKVGDLYTAKISNKIVTVRVDAIREVSRVTRNYLGNETYRESTVYDVTNLTTRRKTTFRSAGKFRSSIALEDSK